MERWRKTATVPRYLHKANTGVRPPVLDLLSSPAGADYFCVTGSQERIASFDGLVPVSTCPLLKEANLLQISHQRKISCGNLVWPLVDHLEFPTCNLPPTVVPLLLFSHVNLIYTLFCSCRSLTAAGVDLVPLWRQRRSPCSRAVVSKILVG